MHHSKRFTCEVYHGCGGLETRRALTWPTLATCRGFWCSTPPWSRKPHGAPPDSVIITSSATILLFPLTFFLLPRSRNYFSNLWFWCVFIQRGPQCIDPMAENQGPSSRALPCSLPATPTSCWRLSGSTFKAVARGRLYHLYPPSHGSSERGRRGRRTGGCVCLLTLRNACPKRVRGVFDATLVLSLRPMSQGCW